MNLTGYAEDAHQRYLSQERFGDLISSIECLNGSIAFKFGSQDTFASIRDEWDWINTGNRIVFITLEAGTCSNTKRQPYLATHVAYDAGSRKATFKAATRTWEDVLPNYNVVLDTQGVLPQGDAALQHRFEGDASIDLNHDFSGNIATLQDVANTSLQFDLECKSCATSGRLDLHVEGSFIPFKISASLKPTGT